LWQALPSGVQFLLLDALHHLRHFVRSDLRHGGRQPGAVERCSAPAGPGRRSEMSRQRSLG
jgi:hypothetical protein